MSNIDWDQLVTVGDKTAATIEASWDALRSERDRRLADTDWLVLRHAEESEKTLTAQQYADLLIYRQALRDLPENTVDPANPVWPALHLAQS